MLREPFWLGLIAVFFVMILIGFVIRITVIVVIIRDAVIYVLAEFVR